MITVETRPVRMSAVQWHQPGDAEELGVQSYRHGAGIRYGLPTMAGLLRVTSGVWIVLEGIGRAQVYSPVEFNHKFKIIEQAHS